MRSTPRFTMLTILLSILFGAHAASATEECNGGGFTDPGTGAPNFPPLQMPFAFDDDWIVGGGGSYFGNGWHCNSHNDYYATDWNRNGGGTQGQPVYPVAAGVVVEQGWADDGYGYRVRVEHSLGGNNERFRSLYAHLDQITISSVGDVVTPWTQIGTVGNTGNSNGAHLHLGLQSYHSGAFQSLCNDPRPGYSTCWSTETPQAPQSRKPYWWWVYDTQTTIDRAVINDGSSYRSGNRPRVILPGFLNNSSWDTNVYVRNNHAGNNLVEVRIYDATGNQVYSSSATLANNGSWKITPGTSVSGGTAVVLAEAGKDVAAVARLQRKNGDGNDAYGSYEGVDQPKVKQVIPIVHRNNSGWYNRIFLFNPDATGSVSASIDFGGSSWCNRTVTIGPLETEEINTYNETCLATGWVGRVTVTAKIAGTNDPGLLAVTSFQEQRSGSTRNSLATATISRHTGQQLYVPLIQNNNSGYLGGLGAEKLAGSGSLTATYREDNAAYCTTNTHSSWPIIVNPIPQSGSGGCESVLAATLDATSSVDYVYAQINQLSGLDATSYPAVALPTWYAYVPYLDDAAGVFRGLQIQNVGGTGTTVTVRYYQDSGASAGSWSGWVPAGGFVTLNSQIPAAARNAEVSATSNLAVVVNNLMPGGGRDKLMDYTAPGRL